MPATTDNDNLLTAFNQHIQAILDLAQAMTGGDCPDVTVNVPTPSVTVNVAAPNVTVNCGGGGGSYPPQSEGEEGGTPPPGTSEPDPIDERKCKVATILTDDLITFTNFFNSANLFNWALDYSSISTLITSIITGYQRSLLSISMATGGIVTAISNLFWTGGLPADIGGTLAANREDIICALYNSTNATDAKNAIIEASTLTGTGATYLEIMLPANALNMLFFATADSEAIINSYAGTADCDGCGNDSTVIFIVSDRGFIESVNGDIYVIGASPVPPSYYVQFHLGVPEGYSMSVTEVIDPGNITWFTLDGTNWTNSDNIPSTDTQSIWARGEETSGGWYCTLRIQLSQT